VPSSSRTLYYYTLIGQTFFRPIELRFQEMVLMTHQLIAVRAGDVIGLHAAQFNPLAWTGVPCGSDPRQRYRYARPPVPATTPAGPRAAAGSGRLDVGRTLAFQAADDDDEPTPCRHYSFTALFGELRSFGTE